MTIEEIKNEVELKLKNIDVKYEYDFGKLSAYKECLKLIEQYNPWHIYPNEKPPKDGYYLVTPEDDCYISTWGSEVPFVTKFEKGQFVLSHSIAWTELPKLYKKEKP